MKYFFQVFQRQICKDGLSSMVVSSDGKSASFKNTLGKDQIKELFTLKTSVVSDTHDSIKCNRCTKTEEAFQKENGIFNEDDLNTWAHTSKMGKYSFFGLIHFSQIFNLF